jgi:FkbM family methyltransferase
MLALLSAHPFASAAVAFLLLALFLLLAGLAALRRVVMSPPPSGGTPCTLPNGLRMQQWQQSETDFLFTEIWGAESAYSRTWPGGGLVFRRGATVLDAGANVGMFSLYAAKMCGGDARIIAFEPIPQTFAVLEANARAASAGEMDGVLLGAGVRSGRVRFEAVPVGLSSRAADVDFASHPHFSIWSTQDAAFAEARVERITADLPRALDTHESWAVRACFPRALARFAAGYVLRGKLGVTRSVRVRLERLSAVIGARPGLDVIDFLKVDVEGAEVDVLLGISAEHWPRIQQVALEVENFKTKDAVLDILRSHGFDNTHWFASEQERNKGVQSQVRGACRRACARGEESASYTPSAPPPPSNRSAWCMVCGSRTLINTGENKIKTEFARLRARSRRLYALFCPLLENLMCCSSWLM